MSDKLKAIFLLLIASLIWGLAFPMNRYALRSVDPLGYSALRYFFGALALAPLALRWGRRTAHVNYFTKTGRFSWIWGGALAGLLLALGNGIQYQGLAMTLAAKAGFINGLYVTMVPLFGLILGVTPARLVWVGLGVSLLGLALISDPGSATGFNRGDAYVLVADLFFASHVFVLGFFSVRVSVWLFIFSQAFFGCFFGGLLAEMTGTFPTLAQFQAIWPFALYGVCSVAGAYLCQALAQKTVTPSSAALVMQTQSIIAAVSGVVFLGEKMTKAMIFGAFLLVSGTVIAQLATDSTKLAPKRRHFRFFVFCRVLVAFLILAVCALAVIET